MFRVTTSCDRCGVISTSTEDEPRTDSDLRGLRTRTRCLHLRHCRQGEISVEQVEDK